MSACEIRECRPIGANSGASSIPRSSSSAHADDPVITESRDLARLCLNAACGCYWMPRLKRGMTTREVGEESLSWRAWNAAPGLPEQSGLRAALSGAIAQIQYCRPAPLEPRARLLEPLAAP